MPNHSICPNYSVDFQCIKSILAYEKSISQNSILGDKIPPYLEEFFSLLKGIIENKIGAEETTTLLEQQIQQQSTVISDSEKLVDKIVVLLACLCSNPTSIPGSDWEQLELKYLEIYEILNATREELLHQNLNLCSGVLPGTDLAFCYNLKKDFECLRAIFSDKTGDPQVEAAIIQLSTPIIALYRFWISIENKDGVYDPIITGDSSFQGDRFGDLENWLQKICEGKTQVPSSELRNFEELIKTLIRSLDDVRATLLSKDIKLCTFEEVESIIPDFAGIQDQISSILSWQAAGAGGPNESSIASLINGFGSGTSLSLQLQLIAVIDLNSILNSVASSGEISAGFMAIKDLYQTIDGYYKTVNAAVKQNIKDSLNSINPGPTFYQSDFSSLLNALGSFGFPHTPDTIPPQVTPALLYTAGIRDQSPNFYLQAVGSPGGDSGRPTGIFLRWAFRDFGNQVVKYLPKGTNNDDKVHIFRTEWNGGYPADLGEVGVNSSSIYNGAHIEVLLPPVADNIRIRIEGLNLLNTSSIFNLASFLSSVDPEASVSLKTVLSDFFTENINLGAVPYLRIYAIEDKDLLDITSCIISSTLSIDAQGRLEGRYYPSATWESLPPAINSKFRLLDRKQTPFNAGVASGIETGFMEGVNTLFFKYETSGSLPAEPVVCTIESMSLIIPARFFKRAQGGAGDPALNWELTNSLFVSNNDTEALNRLGSEAQISGWPRFVGKKAGAKSLVSKTSYANLWSHTTGGIKKIVDDLFLNGYDHSISVVPNPPEITPPTDPLGIDDPKASVGEILNMAAADFHIARMLGLGAIDYTADPAPTKKYVYAAVIKGTSNGVSMARYLSLPTGVTEERNPELAGFTVEAGVRDSTQNPAIREMIDSNGYSKISQTRYLNLLRHTVLPERHGFDGLFLSGPEFNAADHVSSIGYGLEHKLYPTGNVQENNIIWDEQGPNQTLKDGDIPVEPLDFITPVGFTMVHPFAPVLVNDLEYPDDNANYSEKTWVFFDRVKETGFHYYGLYGVDWFSRHTNLATGLPTPIPNTTFPVRNYLVPPVLAGVHYIQEEETPLFTSESEQLALAERRGISSVINPAIIRLNLEWHAFHDIAMNVPETTGIDWQKRMMELKSFRLHWRSAPLSEFKGLITAIKPGSSIDERILEIGGYQEIGGTQIQPVIGVGVDKFKESLVRIKEENYQLTSTGGLTVSGNLVTQITIRLKAKQNPETNQIVYSVPLVGERIHVVENINLAQNWVNQINRNYFKIPFLSNTPRKETVEKNEVWLRGFYLDNQVCIPHPVVYENPPDEDIIDATSTVKFTATGDLKVKLEEIYSGYYGTDLAEQANLRSAIFKGGSVFLKRNPSSLNSDFVDLKIEIQKEGEEFIVYIRREPGTEADSPIQITGYLYPGYQVYVLCDDGILTTKANFEPQAAGVPSKITYLGIQASGIHPENQPNSTVTMWSDISAPRQLYARQIRKPEQPEPFKGAPKFSGPSDLYGNANYPIKLNITDQNTYALVFYRFTEEELFDVVYSPARKAEAYAVLKEATDVDKIGLIESLARGRFGLSIKETGPVYCLPLPDLFDNLIFPIYQGLIPPDDDYDQAKKINDCRKLILGHFDENPEQIQPVFENPALFSLIKTNGSPEHKKPVLKDSNNNLLPPVYSPNSLFDPYPMMRKNGSVLTAVDFNLPCASSHYYFFAAREMTQDLRLSELSELIGPISVLNSYPAPAPVVKKLTFRFPERFAGNTQGVVISVDPYEPEMGITHFKVFRTKNKDDADNILKMDTLSLVIPVNGLILDPLTDAEAQKSFGSTMYYRVAGVRRLLSGIKADGTPEYSDFLSHVSDKYPITIVDGRYPEAPEITLSPSVVPPSGTQFYITSFKVKRVCYKGLYLIYKMTSMGSWEKLFEYEDTSELLDGQISLPMSGLTWIKNPQIKTTENGNPRVFRFKADVISKSGLRNLDEKDFILR